MAGYGSTGYKKWRVILEFPEIREDIRDSEWDTREEAHSRGAIINECFNAAGIGGVAKGTETPPRGRDRALLRTGGHTMNEIDNLTHEMELTRLEMAALTDSLSRVSNQLSANTLAVRALCEILDRLAARRPWWRW